MSVSYITTDNGESINNDVLSPKYALKIQNNADYADLELDLKKRLKRPASIKLTNAREQEVKVPQLQFESITPEYNFVPRAESNLKSKTKRPKKVCVTPLDILELNQKKTIGNLKAKKIMLDS